MENEYKIRKVKEEDAEQYIKLSSLVWHSAYQNIFPESVFKSMESGEIVNKMIKSFAKHQIYNPNQFSYVAEVDGKMIGLMSGTYLSKYEHFSKEDYAELQCLYIHPDYQHKGLGKKFFDVFVGEIKKKDIKKFVIGVLQDNKQARSAYEKWGGKLDSYSQPFIKEGKEYAEVFYTFNLTQEKEQIKENKQIKVENQTFVK